MDADAILKKAQFIFIAFYPQLILCVFSLSVVKNRLKLFLCRVFCLVLRKKPTPQNQNYRVERVRLRGRDGICNYNNNIQRTIKLL